MRNILSVLILVALLMLLGSCEKETPETAVSEESLSGFWISPEYLDSMIVYQKADDFNDGPGYEFKIGGSMIERKNAGWCGTPPITYDNYNGTYELLPDGNLEVVSPYWGGIIRTRYQIISINQRKLTLRFLESGEAK
ncbi:MAG: hypothetical protein JNL22_17070 [Bacteroidales bacterium]|nr:hypothetical protein [Bacteroidales bacterium]